MSRGFHEASAGGSGAAVWYESCSCWSPGQSYLHHASHQFWQVLITGARLHGHSHRPAAAGWHGKCTAERNHDWSLCTQCRSSVSPESAERGRESEVRLCACRQGVRAHLNCVVSTH